MALTESVDVDELRRTILSSGKLPFTNEDGSEIDVRSISNADVLDMIQYMRSRLPKLGLSFAEGCDSIHELSYDEVVRQYFQLVNAWEHEAQPKYDERGTPSDRW